jgi:sec-independent protein translocase protein TatC
MGKHRESTDGEKNMTLSGHLRELRNRLVVCIVCLVVSMLAGLHFAPDLVEVLTGIGTEYGYSYVYIAPQELLLQYFSIALHHTSRDLF